jgi:hypothetical protein
LRALLVLGTVVGALFVLHPGHLLDALAEFPCEGHWAAGHAAAALGGLALVVSVGLAGMRIVQATLAVRRLVRASVGLGPDNSLIVGGDDVVLAAAGITRPRLVVSAGALAHLDDDELAAALAHEHAHIRRCHRYVLLYAEFCRVLGRPLPGTTHAIRQLRFHIERDADRSAVRGRADRGWCHSVAKAPPRGCASCWSPPCRRALRGRCERWPRARPRWWSEWPSRCPPR